MRSLNWTFFKPIFLQSKLFSWDISLSKPIFKWLTLGVLVKLSPGHQNVDSVTNNPHASSIFGERIFVWKICCFDVKNIFSTMCPQTWAQWGTFKVIMGRWWGLLCSRQVKDKLKGNLSELSTMIGWHESGLQHTVTWLEYLDCQATGLGYSLSSPALITPPVFTLRFCLNSWVLTLCFQTSK